MSVGEWNLGSRDLLDRWLGLTDRPEMASSKEAHVRTAVRELFDDGEIATWRVRVLNSLGLASFTLKALGAADESRARVFFHVERGLSGAAPRVRHGSRPVAPTYFLVRISN